VGGVELPVSFGRFFVERLLVGASAELVELGVAGRGGDEFGDLGLGLFWRAWVEGLDRGELHDAEEGGFDGGRADDVLEPVWEGGLGGGGGEEGESE
jgi:hypothetical protein